MPVWCNMGSAGKLGAPMGAIHSPYALPDGTEPLIFADFKNGVYLIDGAAADFDDVMIANPSFGTWDPATLIEGVGICPEFGSDSNLTLHPDLASTLVPDGCTIVPTVSNAEPWPDTEGQLQIRMMDLPGSSVSLRWELSTFGQITAGASAPLGAINLTDGDMDQELLKAAFNFSRTRMAGSWNGRPISAGDLSETTAQFTTSGFIPGGLIQVESIGWYPLQDEADLPGLSAL